MPNFEYQICVCALLWCFDIDNVSASWERVHSTSASSIMRCSYLMNNEVLLSSWFNELMFQLKERRMRGWGRVNSERRSAVFFANCKCAYKFDRFVMFEGVAFPPIVWEILRHVMPLCNITDTRYYPTAAHVNYYKDGQCIVF